MAHHEFAVQLYTLRNETKQDFPGTLRQVAEAGVPAVEFAGFGSYTAAEMRKLLDDVGLVAMGAHISFDRLASELDKVIEDIQTLGAQYLAIPSWPHEQLKTADDFRRAGEALARIGERCKAAGLQFSYHNHAFEFVQFDGKYGLDLLLEAASPDVLTAQFDVGWIAYAGADPIAFLRKYA
jgi:sugar phosphate isomerase/epimerase